MTPHITLPEFCPRPTCPFFDRKRASSVRWYSRFGSFHTNARGRISRFRCRYCGKTCSTQTFSLHYWTHSTQDYRRLMHTLYCCSGLRQHARCINHTVRVVHNRIRHLSRNCLALMDQLCCTAQFSEHLAFDGFESFTRSQYFPNNISILVGSHSQFIHAAVHTLLRRKGAMSDRQKRNRRLIDAHWRPPAQALTHDCTALFGDTAPMIRESSRSLSPLIIATDRHPAYPQALQAVPALGSLFRRGDLCHLTVSSRAARTALNPLFPVNYVDRQIRKNMAEHVRQTVRHGREVNCQMERMAIFLFAHNFLTPHRVCDRADVRAQVTHAQVAGVRPEHLEEVLKRLFSHRHLWAHEQGKSDWQRRIWHHQYENPPIVNLMTGELSAAVAGIGPQKLAVQYRC